MPKDTATPHTDGDVNQRIVNRFARVINNQRLAHAYLFIGPLGAGKYITALNIAKLVNCDANDLQAVDCCCECPSCRQIDSGNHPDVHLLSVEYGEKIKISNVKDILSQIKLRPYLGRRKVFIINNIENMTIESSNALLKTLEEPSANSLLLLTTSVPEKNLDTVTSRCQVIYFPPMSQNGLVEHLMEKDGVHHDKAQFLSYFAQGCLGRVRFFQDQNFFDEKNEMIDQFIFCEDNETYMKKILADKFKTKQLLDVVLSWVRDALLLKCSIAEDKLIHIDRSEEIQRFQKRYSFQDLKDIYEEMTNMCYLLSENLNIKIPLLIIKEKLWGN